MKTKVIFRKFPDGEIIALFPEIVADDIPSHCSSYLHIGQHGAAHISSLIRRTKLATPAEYADLKKELENYGPEEEHYDFIVCQKYTRKMLDARMKQFREYYSK